MAPEPPNSWLKIELLVLCARGLMSGVWTLDKLAKGTMHWLGWLATEETELAGLGPLSSWSP